jgi:hypothetical protein
MDISVHTSESLPLRSSFNAGSYCPRKTGVVGRTALLGEPFLGLRNGCNQTFSDARKPSVASGTFGCNGDISAELSPADGFGK